MATRRFSKIIEYDLPIFGQPFFRFEIFHEWAKPEPEHVYDSHYDDLRIVRLNRRIKRLSKLLFIIVVFFFISNFTVWLNEELLLVLSFTLLYVKGFKHAHLSYQDFVIPRVVEELVWTKLVKRTERIFRKVRFNLVAIYFKDINTVDYIKIMLQRNLSILTGCSASLQALKYDLYTSKLVQLDNFDKLYYTSILDVEIQSVILHNLTSPVGI